MAGLQRSEVSFRRQGSSGLVWDDKILSGELVQLANHQKEDKSNKAQPENIDSSAGNPLRPAELKIERSRSGCGRGFRTGRVPPAVEPPSPKLSACGCCGDFGNGNKASRRPPPKSGKRVI